MKQKPNQNVQLSKLLDMAFRFHEHGNLPEAETIYREILRTDFTYADAWHLLGVLVSQCGDDAAAIELITEAIDLDPEEPLYHYNLGNVYAKLDRLELAVHCYDRTLIFKPDYVEAHYNRATALRGLREFEEAAETYRTALRLKPGDVQLLNDLGGTLRQQGDLNGAIYCYRQAAELDQNNPDIQVNLGLVLEQNGDVSAALGCYENALERKPGYGKAVRCVTDLRDFTLDDREEIVKIESLLDKKQLTKADREAIYWALGKIYDDCGLFGRAFDHYRAANDLRRERKNLVFDAAAYVQQISDLIDTYAPEFFKQRQDFGNQTELPVFVVGMSRSGKSCVERLIVRHAEAFGADEIDYFNLVHKELSAQAGASRSYQERVALLDAETAQALARGYIKHVSKRAGEVRRVVDSMPNYLNVGLIALLFPKARIIHCRRHPLDMGLAIYFKSFAGRHDYAYQLNDIATHFKGYQRLMDHWREVIPNPVLDVDYEDMVTNQKQACHRIFEFCGVDGTEKCQEPEIHLHGRFIDRWKNYEKFIGELKIALGYS